MSRRTLVLLALGALAVRWVYVLVVLGDYDPASDADQYLRLATAVSEGRGLAIRFPFGFVHPSAFRPPLYPAMLGGLFSVTGASVGVAQVLNMALGAGVVVLAAVLGARIAGPRAGLVAGIVTMLYPPMVANDTTLLSEPLSLVLLLAVVLALLDDRVIWAAAGTGLLVLTRPSAQLFAVVLAAWIAWRVGWGAAARFAVVVVLVLTPWVLRNWLLIGEPVLVTSNGFNLAAVYSAESNAAGRFVDPVFEPEFAAERYLRYNEGEWDAAMRRLGVEEIRRDPARVLEVAGENAVTWFELWPPKNAQAEVADGRSLLFRNSTLVLFYAVTAAGLGGLILARRHRGAELLLASSAVFLVASLVTVVSPRLRAPFDLACCIGVGVLVAEVGRRRSVGDDAAAGPGASVVTAASIGDDAGAQP